MVATVSTARMTDCKERRIFAAMSNAKTTKECEDLCEDFDEKWSCSRLAPLQPILPVIYGFREREMPYQSEG